MKFLKILKMAYLLKRENLTFYKPNNRSRKWLLEIEIKNKETLALVKEWLGEEDEQKNQRKNKNNS